MTYDIYPVSSVKGPRKQDGTVAYCVRGTEGRESWEKTFQTRIKGMNADGSTLFALVRALKYIDGVKQKADEVKIHTECSYVRMGFFQMKRWKDLGWTTARGNTVKNKGLWELTDEMLQGNAVSFVNEEDETLLRLWKAVG